MTITTYGTIAELAGFRKAVGADFYVSQDFAGELSRPGMAFWSCRNEELFQPALAAEMLLTSMILSAEAIQRGSSKVHDSSSALKRQEG